MRRFRIPFLPSSHVDEQYSVDMGAMLPIHGDQLPTFPPSGSASSTSILSLEIPSLPTPEAIPPRLQGHPQPCHCPSSSRLGVSLADPPGRPVVIEIWQNLSDTPVSDCRSHCQRDSVQSLPHIPPSRAHATTGSRLSILSSDQSVIELGGDL